MWAFSPRAAPVEALEEILADVQTARPTSMATLSVGSMVGICLAVLFVEKYLRFRAHGSPSTQQSIA